MKIRLILSFICFICFILVSTPLFAEINYIENPNSLSFQLGYFNIMNDNKAIGDFGMEIQGAYNRLFDLGLKEINDKFGKDTSSGTWMRDLYFIATLLVSTYIVVLPFYLSYHEYGHGSRVLASGKEPYYIFRTNFKDSSDFQNNPYFYNFFSYYFSSFFSVFKVSGGSTSTSRTLENYGNAVPSYWSAVITMNGLNNNTYFAEMLSRDVFAGKGHFGGLANYFMNKLAPYYYVISTEGGTFNDGGGDIANISNYYNQKNYHITYQDIKTYNLISTFLSSSTYSYLWGIINIVRNGESKLYHMNIKGFHLPDISMYFTNKGISYKFNTGYQNKDWIFPLSYETIIKGDSFHEFTLGIGRILNKTIIQGGIIISKGFGYYCNLDQILFESKKIAWAGSLGFTHYDNNTFDGERHSPSLKDNYLSSNTYLLKSSLLY